ncbi:uncharacterized protein I206_100576 [Kwoniella pini CBS 10737]|uniref:Uncharacterized protein n=1 Tax=Kwoniella pini CBS 10737 TaxID=1296096 RepID=A0A1B9ID37_9TREE|nr:uncharacterized protein I206_00749 [Kwoniella pini CBS 10737]OCF53446.1 hypothetical protein I206_00749 [Kwoniella pini CBS 10737]
MCLSKRVVSDADSKSTIAKTKNKTFQIDADSTPTGYFLAFFGADIPLLPPTSLVDTVKLVNLCEMFESTAEHNKLLQQRLQEQSKDKVWELLSIASQLDDRALGRQCLDRMDMNSFVYGREPGDSKGGDFQGKMSRLSYEWQGRLYSLALKQEKMTAQRPQPHYRISRKDNRIFDGYKDEPTEVTAMEFIDDWSMLLSRWKRQYLPQHRKGKQKLKSGPDRRKIGIWLLGIITAYLTWQIGSKYRQQAEKHSRYVETAFTTRRQVQVFMPIDKPRAYKNPDFCKTLWSAVVSGYRVTLYNWDIRTKTTSIEEEFDTHKPKVSGLARILSNNQLLQDLGILPQDFVFLVDAMDVILQLAPSVLISRYSLLPGGLEGKPIIAAVFNCWPNAWNSSACLDIPASPLPSDMFYPTGQKLSPTMAVLPIHANSGLVLGSVSELRGLLQKVDATIASPEYPWAQFDQGAFNIHLQKRELVVDNTLSMFYCAEHHTNSLSLLPVGGSLKPSDKYQYPFTISHSDLPDTRPVGKDRRTLNIPVAMHFNGIGAKPGFNQYWDDMFSDVNAADAQTRNWQETKVRIVKKSGREEMSVKEICGTQLGLQ